MTVSGERRLSTTWKQPRNGSLKKAESHLGIVKSSDSLAWLGGVLLGSRPPTMRGSPSAEREREQTGASSAPSNQRGVRRPLSGG